MAATQPAECNIKVVCRFRPLNEAESKNGSTFTSKFLSDNCCKVEDKIYAFDRAYQPHVCQKTIYEGTAKPVINNVLSGYNGTIFAYGQTASGKTHTMEGIVGDQVFQGIIPRAVEDIFAQISSADSVVRFCIKLSYFEIYMERIRDLLNVSKRDLEIREDRNRVPYVKGCTEREVTTAEEMMAAIEEGKANRVIGSTNMNEHSSRSHSVCLINITQEHVISQKKLTGKLCLVDLAGSEKVSKTGADGKQLEEAKRINSSLSVLRKVIFALSNAEAFVPYRESKLTRILQESLGGNAKTTVIVCCSPASYNVEETKSTLLFGVSAKTIKNVVKINEELTIDEWKRLVEKERATLRQREWVINVAVSELEKWRNGAYIPRSDWIDLTKLLTMNDGRQEMEVHCNNGVLSDLPTAAAEAAVSEENQERDELLVKENLESPATFVAEKALLLTKLAEAECEKDIIKSRVDEIKEQLNALLETAESNAPEDAACLENPLVDGLRNIHKKLDALQKHDTGSVPTEEDIGAWKDEDQEHEDTTQITSRQEDVSRQMERLLHQIKEKEQLIIQTVANAENIEKMRHIYEIETTELRQKIEMLQLERDEIQQQATRQSNASKISESRRIRLQELEKQLAECRRKIQDLQKLEKMKAQNDEKVKTLRSEVETMKRCRVKLMRQMRDDNERFRKAQIKIEQQMNQIRQQGKRQQYEAEKTKQTMDRQLTVYRRKYEEAAAVNKRLQQHLEKQKSVRKDRFASIKENGKLIQEIKEYLKDEVALKVSAEEARNLLEHLEQQRSELNKQLHKLERDRKMSTRKFGAEGEPPKKKANLFNGGPSDARYNEAELERTRLEIAALREELENRETQISQLKAKVGAFDVEMREGQRWGHMHTMVHALSALKILFDMTVNSSMEKIAANNRLDDAESKNDDLVLNVARLEKHLHDANCRCDDMAKHHVEEWDRVEREHQNELSESEMDNIMKICDKVEVVENLSEQLERKDMETKKLNQELSKAKVRSAGTRRFFNEVASSEPVQEGDLENQERSSQDNPSGMSRRSRVRRQPVRYGQIVDSRFAIIDPDSPFQHVSKPAGRHRIGNSSRKNKSKTSANSTLCFDDSRQTSTSEDSLERFTSAQAQHLDKLDDITWLAENSPSGPSEVNDFGELTFVKSRSKVALRPIKEISPRPLYGLDDRQDSTVTDTNEEGDSDDSGELKVPSTPLANMGISKAFTPRASWFKPGVAKTKFFQ